MGIHESLGISAEQPIEVAKAPDFTAKPLDGSLPRWPSLY
jgi:hypothetical protein